MSLLLPGRGAEYCDDHVCWSVWLCGYLRNHIFMHVACGCGLVLLRRHCDTLCISSFTDDIIFPLMGPVASWCYGSIITAVCVWLDTLLRGIRCVLSLSMEGTKFRRVLKWKGAEWYSIALCLNCSTYMSVVCDWEEQKSDTQVVTQLRFKMIRQKAAETCS